MMTFTSLFLLSMVIIGAKRNQYTYTPKCRQLLQYIEGQAWLLVMMLLLLAYLRSRDGERRKEIIRPCLVLFLLLVFCNVLMFLLGISYVARTRQDECESNIRGTAIVFMVFVCLGILAYRFSCYVADYIEQVKRKAPWRPPLIADEGLNNV